MKRIGDDGQLVEQEWFMKIKVIMKDGNRFMSVNVYKAFSATEAFSLAKDSLRIEYPDADKFFTEEMHLV